MNIQKSSITFTANKPHILLTGATGYIGSRLSIKLAKEGYDLTLCGRNPDKINFLKDLINKVNGENIHKSKYNFANFELTDSRQVDKFLNENRNVDGVVHLAALNSNVLSINNPQGTFKTNLFGSTNLINSMLDNDIRKILFISTGNVYGQVKNVAKIDEKVILHPETPYAESKAMTEQIIQDYKVSGLQSIILRLFNIAGAGSKEDLTIGGNVVAILMNRLKSGAEFVLNGNKHKTPDGTTIRDFLHVDDACNAIKFSLEKLLNSKENCLYNVGSGKGSSLGEIINLSEKISDKKLNLKINQSKQYEPPVLIVDNSKIKEDTGWKPLYDIKNIITDAWQWCKFH